MKCDVHAVHAPIPHVIEIHHVWPLGHGGPNVSANKLNVCPTGHYNIHKLLALWLKLDSDPGSQKLVYAEGECKYAQLGYERIKRGAL